MDQTKKPKLDELIKQFEQHQAEMSDEDWKEVGETFKAKQKVKL